MWVASSKVSRRRDRMSASDCPSRYSMTRYRLPSPASPVSVMLTMLSWVARLAARASWRKRAVSLGMLGAEDLDGHPTAEDGVARLEDDAHGAVSELANELVDANVRSRTRLWRRTGSGLGHPTSTVPSLVASRKRRHLISIAI